MIPGFSTLVLVRYLSLVGTGIKVAEGWKTLDPDARARLREALKAGLIWALILVGSIGLVLASIIQLVFDYTLPARPIEVAGVTTLRATFPDFGGGQADLIGP
jgi:hypothetical protein